MTVRELIAALEQYGDLDAPVLLNVGRNEMANSREVGEVEALLVRKDPSFDPLHPYNNQYQKAEWLEDDDDRYGPTVNAVNLIPAKV